MPWTRARLGSLSPHTHRRHLISCGTLHLDSLGFKFIAPRFIPTRDSKPGRFVSGGSASPFHTGCCIWDNASPARFAAFLFLNVCMRFPLRFAPCRSCDKFTSFAHLRCARRYARLSFTDLAALGTLRLPPQASRLGQTLSPDSSRRILPARHGCCNSFAFITPLPRLRGRTRSSRIFALVRCRAGLWVPLIRAVLWAGFLTALRYSLFINALSISTALSLLTRTQPVCFAMALDTSLRCAHIILIAHPASQLLHCARSHVLGDHRRYLT